MTEWLKEWWLKQKSHSWVSDKGKSVATPVSLQHSPILCEIVFIVAVSTRNEDQIAVKLNLLPWWPEKAYSALLSPELLHIHCQNSFDIHLKNSMMNKFLIALHWTSKYSLCNAFMLASRSCLNHQRHPHPHPQTAVMVCSATACNPSAFADKHRPNTNNLQQLTSSEHLSYSIFSQALFTATLVGPWGSCAVQSH